MDVFNGLAAKGKFAENLQREVERVKASEEWRREYMTLQIFLDDTMAEGRAEGEQRLAHLIQELTKEGLTKQLPPQSAILLKQFLRKENHCLSSSEIEHELWNGRGSTDQLRQAIQRLRRDLKAVSSDVVIKNVNGNYELKMPISSKILIVTND